jgi:tetratricopeptide (TPR) repeat protein
MVLVGIGYSLVEIGLFETAIPFLSKSIELAPFYIFSRTILALCHQGLGEFEKAEAYLKEALNLNPRNPFCLGRLAEHMILVGKYDEAGKYVIDLESIDPRFFRLPGYKAQLFAARGEKEKALALDQSTVVYSLLGMRDEAIRAIQKDMSEGTPYPYLSLINDPRYKNLRDDARFKQIVAQAKKTHEEFVKKYGNFF